MFLPTSRFLAILFVLLLFISYDKSLDLGKGRWYMLGGELRGERRLKLFS